MPENIKAIIHANDASMKEVVEVTEVLTDSSNFKPMNEVHKAFSSEPFQVRICYGPVLMLPQMLLGIDAIAHKGKWELTRLFERNRYGRLKHHIAKASQKEEKHDEAHWHCRL